GDSCGRILTRQCRITTRRTGAAIAYFVSSLVRRRSNGNAPPGQLLRSAASSNSRKSEMSLWVYGKGRRARRGVYLIDLPWGLLFFLIGVVILLVISLLHRLGATS